MRLHLILPRVEPTALTLLSICPYEGCDGTHFRFLQEVGKPLRDTTYPKVLVHRYECLRCQRTFRVYPKGVTQDHISQRVKGLGMLLYLLGLSYGAVSLALEALGIYMCKSRVYDAVQAAAERVPGLRQEQVFAHMRTPAVGGDVTSVQVKGKWFPLGLTVDDTSGLVLTVDALWGEEAVTLQAWLAPIAEAVGAEILVTDDADAFKTVADELGLDHQVCKSHVKRNTEALIESLQSAVETDMDGSLAAIGVTAEQAVADLAVRGIDLQPATRRGDGTGDHAPPLSRCPPSRQRRESHACLSPATALPGPLELMGASDPLSHLARSPWGDAGWHQ